MARLQPLALDQCQGLEEAFKASEQAVGLVTNNLRIMAHKPDVVKALMGLYGAVFVAPGTVSRELKTLVAYMASASSGCTYCTAHTGLGSLRNGHAQQKIDAIWEYETSELFDDAERAALRVAQLSAHNPNGVSDDDFANMKEHFSDEQIVEIVSALSVYGFFNRFNDTMATPLEDPIAGDAGDKLPHRKP